MTKVQRYTIGAILIVALLSGCSSTKAGAPEVYSIANRQTAPTPVYSRTRWVHLPAVAPSSPPNTTAPMVTPVYHFEMKNKPLKDVVLALASAYRYQSYCAPSLQDQKVTVNALGTIDELAEQLEKRVDAEVRVNHSQQIIQVFRKRYHQPHFHRQEDGYEYQ